MRHTCNIDAEPDLASPVDRMVYEDCEGEERNPIVDGKFTLTPPSD